MTREEADGSTETAACRFWIVSLTVTRCDGEGYYAGVMGLGEGERRGIRVLSGNSC